MRVAIITLLLAGVAASTALAQEDKLLHVTVTSASGQSVFLDRGRSAGIAVGMMVQFFPPGGTRIEGIVRAVAETFGLALEPGGGAARVGHAIAARQMSAFGAMLSLRVKGGRAAAVSGATPSTTTQSDAIRARPALATKNVE